MKAYLTRRYWLAASHRLHSEKLSAEQNRATYGKCNNPHGHGHNYAVEVTVGGQIDPASGMICDLGELDCLVTREVLERFDHQNLNCLPEFQQAVPTSENLCQAIYRILEPRLLAAHLEKVRLEETSMNSFEYSGGDQSRRCLGPQPAP
jgi:6-pyruvoyltetrahydropterin/6-carboxytetrahydropterin synthase